MEVVLGGEFNASLTATLRHLPSSGVVMRATEACLRISSINASLSSLYYLTLSPDLFRRYAASRSPAFRVHCLNLATACRGRTRTAPTEALLAATATAVVVRTSQSDGVQLVTKLPIEPAKMLKAVHPPLEEYGVKASILGAVLLQHIQAVVQRHYSGSSVCFDFCPDGGCQIRGGGGAARTRMIVDESDFAEFRVDAPCSVGLPYADIKAVCAIAEHFSALVTLYAAQGSVPCVLSVRPFEGFELKCTLTTLAPGSVHDGDSVNAENDGINGGNGGSGLNDGHDGNDRHNGSDGNDENDPFGDLEIPGTPECSF